MILTLPVYPQIEEIVKECPKGRQSMLFSATLTPQVESLKKLALNQPVAISVAEESIDVADNLVQEFVRVRAAREGDRAAFLLALLTRTYRSRVIVFFKNKSTCHRLKVTTGMLGVKAAELHGDLSQTQRLESLEQFRDGEVEVLLATDLAAR